MQQPFSSSLSAWVLRLLFAEDDGVLILAGCIAPFAAHSCRGRRAACCRACCRRQHRRQRPRCAALLHCHVGMQSKVAFSRVQLLLSMCAPSACAPMLACSSYSAGSPLPAAEVIDITDWPPVAPARGGRKGATPTGRQASEEPSAERERSARSRGGPGGAHAAAAKPAMQAPQAGSSRHTARAASAQRADEPALPPREHPTTAALRRLQPLQQPGSAAPQRGSAAPAQQPVSAAPLRSAAVLPVQRSGRQRDEGERPPHQRRRKRRGTRRRRRCCGGSSSCPTGAAGSRPSLRRPCARRRRLLARSLCPAVGWRGCPSNLCVLLPVRAAAQCQHGSLLALPRFAVPQRCRRSGQGRQCKQGSRQRRWHGRHRLGIRKSSCSSLTLPLAISLHWA